MQGGSGSDTLYGGAGYDVLAGGAGNDFLGGNAGNDILEGGKGNDELNGGEGNDLYLFNLGDGQDTISLKVYPSSLMWIRSCLGRGST